MAYERSWYDDLPDKDEGERTIFWCEDCGGCFNFEEREIVKKAWLCPECKEKRDDPKGSP